MAFRKKELPKSILKAKVRKNGMSEIDTAKNKTIDYGGENNPITSVTFDGKIGEYETMLDNYNQQLQEADAMVNDLKAKEREIAAYYTATLKSAYGKFGNDANEIEILGGVRISDRKRAVRKAKVTS